MVKVLHIEQNTEKWDSFREGRSGGSGFKDLYSSKDITKVAAMEYLESKGVEVDPKAKAGEVLDLLTAEDMGRLKSFGDKKDGFYKLAAGKLARKINPEDYEDRLDGKKFSMMERGHILESDAIAEFEKRNKVEVNKESVVWQRDDNEDSILSPDGVVGTKRGVEVKCLEAHRMIRAFDENTYPAEYHGQIVKYMLTNDELEELSFVMYTDVMPSLPYLQFDIKRSDIERDIAEYKSFEDSILEQVSELVERLAF